MRKAFQILFIFCLPIIFYGQNDNSYESTSNGSKSFIPSIQNSIQNPDDQELKNKILSNLGAITYDNINEYKIQIKDLETLLDTSIIKDKKLYLEILRTLPLSYYKNKNYVNAQELFEQYFKNYYNYYQNDTGYLVEYSKYIQIYYHQEDFSKFKDLSTGIISKTLTNWEKNIKICYTIINLANYYNKYRVMDSSRYYANLALNQYEKSGKTDYKILSDIYRLKGEVETFSENHELSMVYYDKAIECLLLTNHSEAKLAALYNKKGISFLLNNQLENAIKHFKLVAQIYEKEKRETSSLRITYYNLAMAYSQLEKYENSLFYFNKSLELKPDISNFFTHRFIANTYFALDSIKLAKDKYEKVLEYLTTKESKNKYQIALTKMLYGQFLVEKTKLIDLGETYLSECIVEFYKHFNGTDFNITVPLNILGTHYLQSQQIDRGLDSLQKSLSIAAQGFKYESFYENPDYDLIDNTNFSNNTLAWKAYGLFLRYQKTGSLSDLDASQKTYDFYISCASENRKYLENSSSIITSSQVHYVYNQAINVSYLLHAKTGNRKYIDDIFRFIEGKKSFTLFQSLKILEQKKLLDIPKELLKNEEDLKYQLSLLTEKIKAEENGDNNDSIVKYLRKQEVKYSSKLDSLQEIFKNKYSGFYELKYGFRELSIQEIKDRIPHKTAFLNYSISDSLLHSIAFTHDTVILISQSIDSTFYHDIKVMVDLLKEVDTDNSQFEFQNFSKSSYQLYIKLIAPFENTIKNHQLIVIPDDELNYISFDALVQKLPKKDRPDYRKLKYLIKNYKTNVANSMQIYFNMKKRNRNPNNDIYAFAPYYPQQPNADSLPDEYKNLRPLDYAKLEVNSISKSMNTVSFIDKEATKDTFRENAKYAGILHLAMHTIINDQKPLESKFLFTHISKDKSSMLNTYELLALELEAELAVLSGCSTGDGKLQKGEGVMSLSSGFQYAGVPAIVMSLWEVNDRFGSLVIHKFYENLANGFNKKQALYQAKKDVLEQGNALYAHPYYWAGLTLMGDESKINFISRYRWDKLVIIFSPFLFIIVVLFQTRKKWLIKRA